MNADLPDYERGAVKPIVCLREAWQLIKDEYWLFLGISLVGIFMGGAAPMALLMGPAMCGIHLCLLRRIHNRRHVRHAVQRVQLLRPELDCLP